VLSNLRVAAPFSLFPKSVVGRDVGRLVGDVRRDVGRDVGRLVGLLVQPRHCEESRVN